MEQLQATVQSKTAVPTAQVYVSSHCHYYYLQCCDSLTADRRKTNAMLQPQFIHLAQIWSGFQDEMVLLSVLSNILASLEPFVRGHRDIFTDDMLAPFMSNTVIKSDEERIHEV